MALCIASVVAEARPITLTYAKNLAAGRVSPQVLPHEAEGDLARGFWAYQPDYDLYLPDSDYLLAGIVKAPRFGRLHEAVTTLKRRGESDFTVHARSPRSHGPASTNRDLHCLDPRSRAREAVAQ